MKTTDRDAIAKLYLENWSDNDTTDVLQSVKNANVSYGEDGEIHITIPKQELNNPEIRELLMKIAPNGQIKFNKLSQEDFPSDFTDEDKSGFDSEYGTIKTGRFK